MTKPIIHSIFPTPIYTTKINRGFTKQELNFVKEQKKHCINNLHYNNRKTPGAKDNMFDKRPHLGLPSWFKR